LLAGQVNAGLGMTFIGVPSALPYVRSEEMPVQRGVVRGSARKCVIQRYATTKHSSVFLHLDSQGVPMVRGLYGLRK
jgi:hypothetical protein